MSSLNLGQWLHPEIPWGDVRPTSGSFAAAVGSMLQIVAIILSCDPDLKEEEIEHGGGKKRYWSRLHRGGCFLTWSVFQVASEGEPRWASEFAIGFDTYAASERVAELRLVSHNGDHELVMHYNEACGELTAWEADPIVSLLDELEINWYWESAPRRPQFPSRSPDTQRACVIVAAAADWFLDHD